MTNVPIRIRAFTLVELMVAISIMAILTAIIVTNLMSSRAKARDGKRVSDINQIQLALEFYYDRCHEYPATLSPNANNDSCPAGITLGSFIAQIPNPPGNIANEVYSSGYFISPVGSLHPDNYLLHTQLESTNEVLKDGINESTRTAQNSPYAFASSINCYDANNFPKDYCVGPR
ncbi:MAG: type II secretion system protein [Candidatus Taylorbacteria bacterium]|nr:type II secretion system protein [Candidatus Taylorbacteria bacterium]